MEQYAVDGFVRDGRLELTGLPFRDDERVRVYIVPKARLAELSFEKVRMAMKSITGDLSKGFVVPSSIQPSV